ncbi:MAG TPA: cupin domain-containing protein [Tepidisphaeraceae bacterium]|jgi:anti-sigma factor ChrR (cupin superfamily)|nr:cupin domain-containing protein [Tepidisphaeraceae bacterium]
MEIPAGPLILTHLFKLPDEANIQWEEFREGIEICRLHENPGGSNAALLRYEPGASLQVHYHLGHEYILVLSGSQIDDAGEHSAGTLLMYQPGTSHSVRSPGGCVVLIIRDRPVSFVKPQTAMQANPERI